MCGICGIFSTREDSSAIGAIGQMVRLGAHRGPDAMATKVIGGTGGSAIALGHARLAIIDLSPAGGQPMSDGTGRRWMVFNGEIYNYLELRDELERAGVEFRTRTDTEVALAAYRHWGPEALGRFNGMWALAIADEESGELFLARDRFGVKPLYLIQRPGLLAFASELKQLAGTILERPSVDHGVAADFFLWSIQEHTERTFFAGVRRLPGGSWLRVSRGDVERGSAVVRRFWQPKATEVERPGEAADRFRDLLEDSVRLRLRSDVPVGITLSGGLDSSSIAVLAGGLRRKAGSESPFSAFTAAYGDHGMSEERYADAVAKVAGLRSVRIRPTSDSLASDWASFVRCMEEPFATLSFYSNWKVYAGIREAGVKVILNGQGGDELLLGYERYRVPLLRILIREGRVGEACREVWRARSRGMPLSRMAQYVAYFGAPWLRIARRRRLWRRFARTSLLDAGAGREGVVRDELSWSDRSVGLTGQFDIYQLPHLLRHEDRVSMHHGIESRSPFLDFRLFELMLAVGREWFSGSGWSKAILREAMKGVLPEEVRTRTDKMGFETPTGRLIGGCERLFGELLDRNAGDRLLDVPAIRDAFRAGRIEETVLCSAVSYLAWKEEFGVTE